MLARLGAAAPWFAVARYRGRGSHIRPSRPVWIASPLCADLICDRHNRHPLHPAVPFAAQHGARPKLRSTPAQVCGALSRCLGRLRAEGAEHGHSNGGTVTEAVAGARNYTAGGCARWLRDQAQGQATRRDGNYPISHLRMGISFGSYARAGIGHDMNRRGRRDSASPHTTQEYTTGICGVSAGTASESIRPEFRRCPSVRSWSGSGDAIQPNARVQSAAGGWPNSSASEPRTGAATRVRRMIVALARKLLVALWGIPLAPRGSLRPCNPRYGSAADAWASGVGSPDSARSVETP